MGAEFRSVRTHDKIAREKHVFILEVLHGVLYPEAHKNGLKKNQI
jgi:hypothetical protein